MPLELHFSPEMKTEIQKQILAVDSRMYFAASFHKARKMSSVPHPEAGL